MPLRWFSGEFRQRRFDLLTRLVVIFYNAAVIQQLMSYPHAFKVYLRLVEVAVVLVFNGYVRHFMGYWSSTIGVYFLAAPSSNVLMSAPLSYENQDGSVMPDMALRFAIISSSLSGRMSRMWAIFL